MCPQSVSEERFQIGRHIRLLKEVSWICSAGPCIQRPLFEVYDIIVGIRNHELCGIPYRRPLGRRRHLRRRSWRGRRALAGYLREERPAPLKEIPLAWVPQHPPPPPAAQSPPRRPTPPRSTLHIGPSYNKKNSDNETPTPLALIPTLLFVDFVITPITAALHLIDP